MQLKFTWDFSYFLVFEPVKFLAPCFICPRGTKGQESELETEEGEEGKRNKEEEEGIFTLEGLRSALEREETDVAHRQMANGSL